jgi:hypothetical protein
MTSYVKFGHTWHTTHAEVLIVTVTQGPWRRILYYLQWNLDSLFLSGVLKKNDGYGKTIDAGAYIKWIKTATFAYVYLLNQKTYTNDIISTVKSNLHYLFLKKVINPPLFSSTFLFQTA